MDWAEQDRTDPETKMHGEKRAKNTRGYSPDDMGSDAMGGYSLDDYIYSLEARGGGGGGGGERAGPIHPDAAADIYSQLQQKERDLILAAELGKALLEKNEDLSKQNEKIAEEFSQKLEELEQEKYHLRRRLEVAEEEYELKVSELQTDIQSLRALLDQNENSQRQAEREKSLLITQLTEQNQRLTSQLKDSSKTEESLTCELQSMRDQVNHKKTSMTEHVTHLETLRDEITIMTERKLDLERRIEALYAERDGLSSTLDESADRIVMLEKESREQDSMIRNSKKEIDELKATNSALTDRLDSIYRSSSISPHGNLSLLNEMEISDSEKSLNGSRRPFSNIDEDIDDIECDNPECPEEIQELKQEILSAYQQLKNMCGILRQRGKQRRNSSDSLDTTSSSEEPQASHVKVGLLHSVMQELKGLLHDILRKEAKGSCPACGTDVNDRLKLEVQLHKTTESFEKLERTLKKKEDESKAREDEMRALLSKLSVTEVQLKAAEEERDTLKGDLENTEAGRDVLIKKAWETRDAAVKRKNNTEIELARTRIDVMQINSQLMEAIQQKVELSQQLDQWQQDMQELLEEQMNRKMKAAQNKNGKSGNESDSSQTNERKKSKLFSFLKLGQT